MLQIKLLINSNIKKQDITVFDVLSYCVNILGIITTKYYQILFDSMGSLCNGTPGAPAFFSAPTISGIIFNDSDYEIQYDVCGTKSKTVKQSVSNDVSASAKITANPLAIGGQASAGAKEQSKRQIQEEDTLAQVWIKPHHYSTQGLLNLPMSKQHFLSISYFDKYDNEDNLQSNILITCKESICFIITKDLACESLTKQEVEFYKKEFRNDYDQRKVYKKTMKITPDNVNLNVQQVVNEEDD